MAEAIGYTEVKAARKPHDCWWCAEPIAPGESYVRWVWVDYPSFDTVKCHPECRDAWSIVTDQEGGFYSTMPHEHTRGLPEHYPERR